ncbi:MAG TPA: hypothetical protein VE915_08975 [Actinomycetota bacterium]|jgi:hypothetical protein|nr:hypothetical protein [Actinomycetota bacterium]
MGSSAEDDRRRHRGGLGEALRGFLYGMGGYEFVRHALETRAALDSIFMAITVGDMIGVPVLPPYYALRLLPYVTPEITMWKRRVLREHEATDQHEFDLHGV